MKSDINQVRKIPVGTVCTSISDTFKGNAQQVVLVNTSDVLEGKVLNHQPVPNKNLRGQFKKTFCKEDILYSEIRPQNKRFAFIDFSPCNYIASTKLMVLRADQQQILPQYLYYFLTSNFIIAELQMLAETRSGTFPQITFSELANIMIPVPSLDVQQSIVDIVKCIDDKIELNQKINENLERQAEAIFAEHFLNNSSIPDGWRAGNLLEIADYLNGLAMQKYRPKDREVGLPVLKIKELRQGACDGSSELCSPSIKSEYIIHDGDVIFSWSGSLLVDFWCGKTCGLNQHLFKVTSNNYDKWFYYSWTLHHLNRFIAIAADKATTMGHIKREELAKAEVLIPSKSDYDAIGAVMKPIYDLIIANRLENRKLEEVRDSLLPKLMAGEIDLKEV